MMASESKWKRQPLGRLAGYILRRLLADRALNTASALAYTSLMSLVPLLAVLLAVLTLFPTFASLRAHLQTLALHYLLPKVSGQLQDAMANFVDNAGSLSLAGSLGLLVTAVMLLTTIEAAFNQIFRVATPRSPMSRLLLYGTAMTLGPILLGASFSLSAWFWAARDWASQAGFSALAEAVTLGAPQALLILALTLLYAAVPNCRVAPADAAAGGVLAGLAFTLLRWGFGLYVADDQTYENIYGAMAVLPLSLLWLYLSWAVVLSGAELVAALPEWRRGDPN